jgi:hypothetical protein
MVPRFKITLFIFVITTLLVIWGCEHSSEDLPTGAPVDVPSLIVSGWENFENGDFTQAITDFTEATSRDAYAIEAYLGLGWSLLRDGQFLPASSNIFFVSTLLNLGVVEDPVEYLRYQAESAACLAGVYQGLYPEDIATNAPLVIENVDEVLDLTPNFVFSHDSTVTSTSLIVAKADAYFVLSDFAHAFQTISVVYDLADSSANIQIISDFPVAVQTLYDSTTYMGYGRLTIPGAQFIDIISVTDDSIMDANNNYIAYTVAGFVAAGEQLTFYGTPIPQEGDLFLVTYYNSTDYMSFLVDLRQAIDMFR